MQSTHGLKAPGFNPFEPSMKRKSGFKVCLLFKINLYHYATSWFRENSDVVKKLRVLAGRGAGIEEEPEAQEAEEVAGGGAR
jgi:hypothetical protein